MSDTNPSHKEVSAEMARERRGNMRNSLIMAGVFTALAVFIAYLLLTRNFSFSYFWALVGLAVISILACFKTIFEAGCYRTQKEYELKLLVNEQERKTLEDDYDNLVAFHNESVIRLVAKYADKLYSKDVPVLPPEPAGGEQVEN